MGNIYGKLRGRLVRVTGVVLATLGLLVAPLAALTPTATAQAGPPSLKPWNITAGSDGNMWFTELDANRIGRITPSGVITQFNVPTANAAPYGITAGSDGALWFTENNVSKVGRIATDGTFTEYDLPRNANNDEVKSTDITKAADGTLWYAAKGSIGKITTGGVAIRYDLPSPYTGVTVNGITNSTSGIYFTASDLYGMSAVGHVKNDSSIEIFPLLRGMKPGDITGEAGDRLWFTTTNTVGGTLSSSLIWSMYEGGGGFAPYNIPANSNPSNIELVITNKPDFWYAGRDNDTIVHFMRAESPDIVTQLMPGSCPQGLTYGPDAAMWFTEACSNKIGRIDSNGNLTEYPITGIPATPTNLNAASPATQANLSWAASSGAASYNVYRNGTLVGTTSNTTYGDSPTSGTYSYYVKAVGNTGLESDASNTITVIVATAPLVTIINPAHNSTVSGTVTVTGTVYSASTYSRSFYIFNSNGQAVGSQYKFAVPNSTTNMSYTWDTTQVPNGVYTLNLSARDSQGNKDANSTSVVKVTVQN